MTIKKHSGAVGWLGGLIALCLAAPSLALGLEMGSGNGLHGALRGEIRMTMQNGGTLQSAAGAWMARTSGITSAFRKGEVR